MADGEGKIAAQKEVALARDAMLNGKMGACGMHFGCTTQVWRSKKDTELAKGRLLCDRLLNFSNA
jgi:hypothetical protein